MSRITSHYDARLILILVTYCSVGSKSKLPHYHIRVVCIGVWITCLGLEFAHMKGRAIETFYGLIIIKSDVEAVYNWEGTFRDSCRSKAVSHYLQSCPSGRKHGWR